jgi:RNA polymerase sigma factor (sigma-70 family)
MLRITTIEENGTRVVLRVEGRLSGHDVPTLIRSCRSCRMPPALDLSGVSFADAEGIRAVEDLLGEGLRLVRSSPFVLELLGRSRTISSSGAAKAGGDEAGLEELLPRFDADGRRLDVMPPWPQSPDELQRRPQTRRAVDRCIRALPGQCQQVLLLRDVQGLDAQATADALGISPGEVKARLHRARMALRTLLERELLAASPTIAA